MSAGVIPPKTIQNDDPSIIDKLWDWVSVRSTKAPSGLSAQDQLRPREYLHHPAPQDPETVAPLTAPERSEMERQTTLLYEPKRRFIGEIAKELQYLKLCASSIPAGPLDGASDVRRRIPDRRLHTLLRLLARSAVKRRWQSLGIWNSAWDAYDWHQLDSELPRTEDTAWIWEWDQPGAVRYQAHMAWSQSLLPSVQRRGEYIDPEARPVLDRKAFITSRPWFHYQIAVWERNTRLSRLSDHQRQHTTIPTVKEQWQQKGAWEDRWDHRRPFGEPGWKWRHECPSPEPEFHLHFDTSKLSRSELDELDRFARPQNEGLDAGRTLSRDADKRQPQQARQLPCRPASFLRRQDRPVAAWPVETQSGPASPILPIPQTSSFERQAPPKRGRIHQRARSFSKLSGQGTTLPKQIGMPSSGRRASGTPRLGSGRHLPATQPTRNESHPDQRAVGASGSKGRTWKGRPGKGSPGKERPGKGSPGKGSPWKGRPWKGPPWRYDTTANKAERERTA